MSFKHLARYALSMPPHVAFAKTMTYAGRILRSSFNQISERKRSSYQERTRLPLGIVGEKSEVSAGNIRGLKEACSRVMEHRFDLLGSGWTEVNLKPGTSPQVSPGNRQRSAEIRDLIGSEYAPIDWQLDFKSGYRWRADSLSGTLRYGHEPNVDVKVPWELARMQHLSWLAFEGGRESALEFRTQVLDFAAANPPGYGVNWLCTMDVAIRAANILVAYNLFIDQGTEFDEEFLNELHSLILDHGKHIAANLEWHDLHRANHYLADVVGLLFVAAYLPRSGETDSWLAFSVQQLISEVERQFHPDGSNFEASTSYHRLSAEMVTYATALVLGLPEDKKAALVENHQIPGSDEVSPFPTWYFERLERMAEFTLHVTKPNGQIAQIGDNDSGRFLKICPSFVDLDEQHLDHRATVAAINGLFDRSDFAEFSGPDFAPETDVVKALTGGQTIASDLKKGEKPAAVVKAPDGLGVIAETIIELPDAEILSDVTAIAYPGFGLYIWRSPRFFLSVRCGPVGQNGNGGHAHNDQLAIELNIDGEDWIADPGTYLYTPSPNDRNAYRSIHAHAGPKIGDEEPSRLDLGLFRLEDNANAECLTFGPDSFEGMHQGYGVPLHRRIHIQGGEIRIIDSAKMTGQTEVTPVSVKSGEALRKLWSLNLAFSPGYGLRE